MHQVQTIAETRTLVAAAKAAGDSIGFVPTMGALHQGHLSLVEASVAACDRTIVSIFLNPTQFGPQEDLAQYPRTLEQDLRQLEAVGCWLVFTPPAAEMYGPDFDTAVEVGAASQPWEGAARPTHFRGVATVVLKLLNIVAADRAYFGHKDYQQSLVVQQLVRDLNVPVEICVEPTVREADGLAMSSRNAYLTDPARRQAAQLWQALQLAQQLYVAGETRAVVIRDRLHQFLAAAEIEVEYIALLEQGTVQEVTAVNGPTVVVLAARVGTTRLIDNHTIGPTA